MTTTLTTEIGNRWKGGFVMLSGCCGFINGTNTTDGTRPLLSAWMCEKHYKEAVAAGLPVETAEDLYKAQKTLKS